MTQANLQIVRTVSALRDRVKAWREAGESVALVPTMGALHSGHLQLVREATKRADHAVVSIFVNPTQFAPNEDLARYPRDEDGDAAKLAAEGCELVWAPTPADMYPEGFATRIVPGGAALGLEADFRPHFFPAVATVCCKLFSAVTPDVAVFGEKDYQQLCVVRQMVRDLNLPLEIAGMPTVREADGLALSSRNAYLSADERAIAPALNRVLVELAQKAATAVCEPQSTGAKPRPKELVPHPRERDKVVELPAIAALCSEAVEALIAAGFSKVDYVAVREAETLNVVSAPGERRLRILAAAWLGQTRLIDNVAG